MQKVLIIGGGIAGMSLALLLQRQGRKVLIVEKRDYRSQTFEEGRSINFTLTERGLDTLAYLNLKEEVLANTVALHGRIIHVKNDKSYYHPYGSQPNQALYSIQRKRLIEILYQKVIRCPKIELLLNTELLNINQTSWKCEFLNTLTQEKFFETGDFIVGADGAFSTTRRLMLAGKAINYHQKFFDWKYKELYLTSAEATQLNLSAHYLHVWSRAKTLLVAIPNPDGSFGTLFSTQDTKIEPNQNLNNQFLYHYRDLLIKAPSLSNTIMNSPASYLVSISIDQWVFNQKVVLIGDACHAVFPFYGQGMNAALEDVFCLAHILESNMTLEAGFSEFEKLRKPNAVALSTLSEAHFYQLQQNYLSPRWEARNKLDYWLAKIFPKHWHYEYEMVAHTHIPYQKILQIIKRQNLLRPFLGLPLIELFIVGYMGLKKILFSRSTALYDSKSPPR